MAYEGIRLRSVRSLRHRVNRHRNDSEDETVTMDWSQDPKRNLHRILSNVVSSKAVSKGQRLGYLNCFTKLCSMRTIADDELELVGYTLEEIFLCLRVSLFHQSADVRAAGLRAVRYLLTNREAVETLYGIRLHHLIVRSLDIRLDNKTERIQALRLIRKLLSLHPSRLTKSVVRCLVAIGSEGSQEKDCMSSVSLATLAEIMLLQPSLVAETGAISAISDSILSGGHSPAITEALLATLFHLLNSPVHRRLILADIDLQRFMAPYTDSHFSLPSFMKSQARHHPNETPFRESDDMKELKFTAAKTALLSIFRSWPGLIHVCRTLDVGADSEQQYLNGFSSLLEMLHIPFAETRRRLLEFLFELFQLPLPLWTADFDGALASSHPSVSQDAWKLYEGFVAAEAIAILPHNVKHRLNLRDNHRSLLLYLFVVHGGLDSLVSVIINPSTRHASVRATLLLGELLHLSAILLPTELVQRCHTLSPLLDAATNGTTPDQRQLALAAISCLNRLHSGKKHPAVPCSLYLDQLLQFARQTSFSSVRSTFYASSISRLRLGNYLNRNEEPTSLHLAIKDCGILFRESNDWDWALIGSLLKWPGDGLRKLSDSNAKNFVRKLLTFYKPTSKCFSNVDSGDPNGRQMIIGGCHFLDFLLDESKSFELIDEFLTDCSLCFAQITLDSIPSNAIMSPSRMLSTLSHAYFLFVGRLSNSNIGKKRMEKLGIYQHLLEMLGVQSHHQEVYVKLLISSLDYGQDGAFSRTLICKALTSSNESTRVYATGLMRASLRIHGNAFSRWALEQLVQQLMDPSDTVALIAFQTLDEASDSHKTLELLTTLRPQLLAAGDRGLLLLLRFVSTKNGYKLLSDANFISHQLSVWRSSMCFKYVLLVEDALNETFTCHRRGEDGSYGRRSERKSWTVDAASTACIPAHFYGELAKHQDGYDLLAQERVLAPLCELIRRHESEDTSPLRLKAALWAIGHVLTSYTGFQNFEEVDVIDSIVELAAQSPTLSLRGTGFYVLGLISTTEDGANYLQERGWEAVRRSRSERWPLVKDTLECGHGRPHTGSHLSSGSAKTVQSDDLRSLDSELNGSHEEDEMLFRSLPALQSDRLFKTLHQLKQEEAAEESKMRQYLTEPAGDPRPRSSSDCQARNLTNGTLTTADVESDGSSGIWIREKSTESVCDSDAELSAANDKSERHDSGVVRDGRLSNLPSRRNTNLNLSIARSKSNPKRKTSEPFGLSFHRLPAMFHRSQRVSEPPPVALMEARSASILTRAPRLSPVTSSSCLTSVPPTPTFRPQLSAQYSTLPRHSSQSLIASPLDEWPLPSTDSIPSAVDAVGYATLRAIQKKRVFSHRTFSEGDRSRVVEEQVTLDESTERRDEDPDDEDSASHQQEFMGICLPHNTAMLFNAPVDAEASDETEAPSFEFKTHLDRLSDEEIFADSGLDLHTVEDCLLCNGKKHQQSTVNASTDSMLARREVLRFVTNLSGSVTAKAAEQGLLSLKQKHPNVFNDLCLYSEVSLHLATYNFRLQARRFLQELFLDLDFHELRVIAEKIVNGKEEPPGTE